MQDQVKHNGAARANSHAHTPHGANGAYIYTVAEVAAMLKLKEQPNGKFHGAPNGTGKTKDGFILCPGGNAFTNDGTKYTSRQVAKLAGIDPDHYAPVAEYNARNGNGTQSRPTTANGAGNARKSPANAPFDWARAQTFDYTDETGEMLYQVGRIGDGAAKQIRQRKPDGRGGWLWQLGDVRRVLYRLSDVATAHTVFICEGEKAAITLNEAFEREGLLGECVATTNAQGAGKWQDDFCEQLDGAAVCVLPDFDGPGDAHGAAVCASIEARGRATVKRVDIPNLPEKGDAFDYIEAGGTVSELLNWFEAAPNWKPEPPARRFNFAPLAEVMTRPDPDFLIYRVLTLGGTSLLTAKHASFKSFIALDMGLSVAVGRAWHGFNTRRGAVVYIAAEGSAGIKKRARAWLDFYDEETPANFVVLDIPFQVADDKARADFIAEVADLKPALIILDTLARCAVGLEENSSKDMGGFADALGELARASGAHVMTVHHNNKGGDYRGSSAVPAAVDTHLSLERDGARVKLEMPKQKDADELLPIVFEKIEVPIMGTRGQTHSLVFKKLDNSEGRGFSLSGDEQKILDALIETHSDDGATSGEWHRCCEPSPARATFQRARKRLLELKFVSTPNAKAHSPRYFPADPNAPEPTEPDTEADDDTDETPETEQPEPPIVSSSQVVSPSQTTSETTGETTSETTRETPENGAKVVSNGRETTSFSEGETTAPETPIVSNENETTLDTIHAQKEPQTPIVSSRLNSSQNNFAPIVSSSHPPLGVRRCETMPTKEQTNGGQNGQSPKAKYLFAPDPEKVARLAQLRAEVPPTKCTSCGDTDLSGAFYSLENDAVRTECAQCFALLSDAPPPEKPKKKSKRAKANAGAEPYNVAATGDDLEKVTT
jgi:hypothetical protein